MGSQEGEVPEVKTDVFSHSVDQILVFECLKLKFLR